MLLYITHFETNIQDENGKEGNKTKMLRPRQVKLLQQECIMEKKSSVATRMFVIKK